MDTQEPRAKLRRLERLQRGKEIIEEKRGILSVRPYRADGYVNVLNRYGSTTDNSEKYEFVQEPFVPDMDLTIQYEDNGLFSKIIDTPAEEAVKHGFELGIKDKEIQTFVDDALDELEWEEKAATAIKWSRLYGGAIIVMLVNDGRGLEEPMDWKRIKSIDELRVYERAVVQPDYTSLYNFDPANPLKHTTSKFGMPELYYVNSIYGSFVVHESRCLVFRNGILPEKTSNPVYRFWGTPEYVRLRRAMRDTITAHGNGPKLLDRSVQPIYKMKDLAANLSMEGGDELVMKRLELIDLARGILNSIAIDKDGEDYDFKSFQFTGVKDVIDSTCNMLSAITNIPQTILFGRSPAGQNSTGDSDLENYYNFVERIQKGQLKRNLRTLLDILFKAGTVNKDIDEVPDYKLEFSPLWSLSETEQATVDQTKATTAQTKAQTAQVYVDMQAMDPSEVRAALAKSEELDIEGILDEADDGWGIEEAADVPPMDDHTALEQMLALPETAASAVPQDMTVPKSGQTTKWDGVPPTSAATIVVKGGMALVGNRMDVECICGPGGHIEAGESTEDAARREAMEEFGIKLGDLLPMGQLDGLPEEYGTPAVFLCTDFDGEPVCDEKEMCAPRFMSMSEISDANKFLPFARSIEMMLEAIRKG